MGDNSNLKLPNELFIHCPFWQSRLESLANPVAIRMAQDLDIKGPLGIGDSNLSFWKGFKHSFGKKDSNIDFLLRIKQQHPTKIILVQIGEFYETWGMDSVFLVEHCGINRMGRKGPRAGMPLANIQATLDDLSEAGFSVVVCEQADDIHKKGRKVRFISEIITPSSPTYTYGLAMSHKANICFPEAPPEFGICHNSKGIKVIEVNPDLRTTLILEGLTQEAAIIRLNKYSGRMNRIFLHENCPKTLIDAANLKFHNLIKIQGYSSRDFANRVEELIKIDLNIDANINFIKTKPVAANKGPKPLYQQSAKQIGILPKRGIPDLIDVMLPKGSPATCKYIMRNLLLSPPPLNYASSLRKSIIELQNNKKELPTLIVSNPVKYIKTLNKNEAHPEILKDLFCLSQIFLECKKKLNNNFIKNILQNISYISAIKADVNILKESSAKIIEILTPILPIKDDPVFIPQNQLIPPSLFERIEDEFRARISPNSNTKIKELYAKISKAAQNYEKIISQELIPVIKNYQSLKNKGKKVALTYDIQNNTIWLLGHVGASDITKYKLIRPIDRYNKEVKDRFSTKNVEEALQQYKELAGQAYDEIKNILKQTSKELSPYCLPIIHLATFSNLTKTLYLHIKECQVKGWTTNFTFDKNSTNRIDIKDFFPYWMKPKAAVTNSLVINNACLLTGHNMAGKSTLIRSLAVSTLLASCGFMSPAQNISLSQEIDGWYVRTGASDDPEAGLSSFGVEMADIRVALRDATNKSFLLIDELGKGTESQAGHAIAASVLEHLAQKNIRSIFATHWHEIFNNDEINLENIKLIKMLCHDEPTFKVVEGFDLNSSAFYTAKKMGIDNQIIKRAKEIANNYQKTKNQILTPVNINKKDSKNSDLKAKKLLAIASKKDPKEIKTLNQNQVPPLNETDFSIVYILKTPNNFYYVGETDNFINRVISHKNRLLSNDCEFFYTKIQQGKSMARKIEQNLISLMKSNNFPMLSIADSNNIYFSYSEEK